MKNAKGEETFIATDMVVRARAVPHDLFQEFQWMVDELHGAGDAVIARGMDAAIHEGYSAGRAAVSAMPEYPGAWRAAAARHEELFAALDPGARITGLVAREARGHDAVVGGGRRPGSMRALAPFPGFSASGADILMAADAEALAQICGAADGQLFAVLRSGIRSGAVVCYILRRRCDLEARGFEELLDGLGFAFMGACR